jgi:tRNA pseudouridine38-40 synthase
MPTFMLTLSYDGSKYCGWQIQQGQVSLQETFERALAKITGEAIRVSASGRTDAGVHALGQVVGFQSETQLAPEVLQKALNAELPRDMAVVKAQWASEGFHATRHAVRKLYRYTIDDGPTRDVFARQFAWYSPTRLDAAAMHRAAQALVGRHDFSSFETHGSPRRNSVRTIFEVRVGRVADAMGQRLTIEIEGDGFLYNMVRAIVGTLVEVGRGVEGDAWLGEVLAARHRKAAGQTAPPQGLCLVWVEY